MAERYAVAVHEGKVDAVPGKDKNKRAALPNASKYNPRFVSPINSPSWEWRDNTQFLQVTTGCSHNGCRYCTFFKNVQYGKVPLDEVEFYLRYIALCDKVIPVKRVFLQASNAFHLSYDELMEIAELVHKRLPNLETIGSYGRMSDLRDKSVEQLRSLHDAGYSQLFFGVESADDNLLSLMNKGYDSAELYEAGAKLKESGIPWACTIMFGLGGHGYGFDHAVKTAEFFNAVQPNIVGGVSMTLAYDPYMKMVPPLFHAVERGEFVEAGEIERFEEMREFIRHLDAETLFLSRHSTMPVGFAALIPEKKEELIAAITKVIDEGDEEGMRKFRESVTEV